MSLDDQLFRLPHVASRLFDQPLAIERSKLHVIASVLAPRLGVALEGLLDVSLPQARVTPRSQATDRPYALVNTKAVIPVFGTLVQRAGSMDALSELTSYEQLRHAVTTATEDPQITESVFHIDSGGGEAMGLPDFLDFIQVMGARKPITAFTDGMAASAAYGIFSAASRRIITQDAMLGSIGVRMLHVDQVKRNDMMGLVVTEFFAGARKVDFSPHETLTEEKRVALQALVDTVYGNFTTAVAKNLGVTQQFVMDTEAGLFVGQQAIDQQLAQHIGTLDSVLNHQLPASKSTQSARAIVDLGRSKMEPITTVAALIAAYPDLTATIRTEAAEAAKQQGAQDLQAERARIQEILDLAPIGCQALAAECCFTAPVSVDAACKKFRIHEKALGPERLVQMRADAPDPISPASQSDNQDGAEAGAALRAAAERRNLANQQRHLSLVSGRRA